jgi:hypothetical protein
MQSLDNDFKKLIVSHRALVTTFMFYRLAYRVSQSHSGVFEKIEKRTKKRSTEICSLCVGFIFFLVLGFCSIKYFIYYYEFH